MQIFTVLDKILNRMLARQHSFVVEEEHGFPKLPRPEGVKGQGFFVEIGFRDLAVIGEGVGCYPVQPRAVSVSSSS